MLLYPLSRTNKAIHALSRRRSNRRPHSESTSTSSKPSMRRALFASMQSALASLFRRPLSKLDDGVTILFKDRSNATVKAMAMQAQVSSSPRRSPGAIHGTLTINARTISTDLRRCIITLLARFLQCLESLFDKAAADGRKRAAADRIDVNKKADSERTNDTVWITGSSPHRVCARCR